MDQGLISKKELLALTGISYGQLYRWKRKSLIPEDWFIRKSTFTGQETFFPKDKILARVDKIKNMKEDLSLDDLADIFSLNPTDMIISKEEIKQRGIVSHAAIDLFIKYRGDVETLSFEEILYVYALDKMLQTGEVSLEEGKVLLQVLEDNYKNFGGKNCELVFVRKLGVSTCLLIPGEAYFESGAKVARLNMSSCVEELKIRIG